MEVFFVLVGIILGTILIIRSISPRTNKPPSKEQILVHFKNTLNQLSTKGYLTLNDFEELSGAKYHYNRKTETIDVRLDDNDISQYFKRMINRLSKLSLLHEGLQPTSIGPKDSYEMGEIENTEFIGQKDTVEKVCKLITDSFYNDLPCEHMNFVGPVGLGKVTLGKTMSYIRYRKYILFTPSNFMSKKQIVDTIKDLTDSSFVIFEDVHLLTKRKQQIIGELIDAIPGNSDQTSQICGYEVEPLTIICTYCDTNSIPPSLKDRILWTFVFDHYTNEEMKKYLLLNS